MIRKKVLYILLLVFCFSGVYAQRINFNQNWKFELQDIKGAEQVNFDDKQWRVLDLPHDWSIEG